MRLFMSKNNENELESRASSYCPVIIHLGFGKFQLIHKVEDIPVGKSIKVILCNATQRDLYVAQTVSKIWVGE